MPIFDKNVFPMTKAGYHGAATQRCSTIALIGNTIREKAHPLEGMQNSLGHMTTFRASFHGGAESFAKCYTSSYSLSHVLSTYSEALKNPLAVVDSAHLHQLPTGEYTELNLHLIKAMGTPIELPLAPSLSWNAYHGDDPYSNIAHAFKQINYSKSWIDSRGTLSHIGAKWRSHVSNSGRRLTLTTQDYFNNDPNDIRNYSLNKVSGAVAAKPGNYFLYRQPIDLWVPETKTFKSVFWIGLATCATLKTVIRLGYNTAVRIAEAACSNEAISTFGIRNHSRKTNTVTPFDRYCNQPRNISWDSYNWTRHNSLNEDNYRAAPSTDLIEIINANEALTVSPLALLVKRLEDQSDAKERTLQRTKSDLEYEQITAKVSEAHVEKLYEELGRINKNLAQHKNTLHNAQEAIARISSAVTSQTMICSRITEAIAKKKAEFEAQKESYARTIEEQKSNGRFKNFSEGLAKSGIVLVDIEYTGPDDRVYSARRFPNVIDSPKHTMSAVRLETNRPIPIIFGLDEAGISPRMSGPHKVKCGIRRDGEVYAKIGSLYPWSTVGMKDEGRYFKPYPHCGWLRLDGNSPSSYISSLTQSVEICMGELAAVIAVAFRRKSAKQVALAVLSFLQSVDPEDEWGRSYKYFPLADELTELKAPSFTNQLDNGLSTSHWYYTTDSDTKYMFFDKDRKSISWGDCKVVNGIITELTRKERFSSISTFREPPTTREWRHQPLGYRAIEHQGEPNWHYRNSPLPEDSPLNYVSVSTSV